MANILLMPVGSHGDVHPFVALGQALQARGHEATLITSAYFEALAKKAGLPFSLALYGMMAMMPRSRAACRLALLA